MFFLQISTSSGSEVVTVNGKNSSIIYLSPERQQASSGPSPTAATAPKAGTAAVARSASVRATTTTTVSVNGDEATRYFTST